MAKKSDNNSEIIPLGDRVLLEEIKHGSETKTASGIIIPESANSDHHTKKGRVISVGDGKLVDGKMIKPDLKKGQTVLYSWGDEMKVDGKKYIVVNTDNILAIIN